MENAEKKEQKVVENINDFFREVSALRKSEEMTQWLRFMQKMRTQSLFNSTLVHLQRPNVAYYATKQQWEKQFNRTIKALARPLVILIPFGPVDFVYDVEDTEGEVLPETFIRWMEEKDTVPPDFDLPRKQENLVRLAAKLSITVKKNRNDDFEAARDMRGALGRAVHYIIKHDARTIELSSRYNHPAYRLEEFGVLLHEVAHHLLGHLGSIWIPDNDKKDRSERSHELVRNRSAVSRSSAEIEAELSAYLVFAKYGLGKNSAPYMANWLTEGETSIGQMSEVIKIAERIHKMCEGIKWWK